MGPLRFPAAQRWTMKPIDFALRQSATSVGWTLLAVALALPWLMETHAAPWTMFYQDLGTALAFVTLAGWACVRSSAGWRVTVFPAGAGALALAPLLQAVGGMNAPAAGAMAALYLVGFVVAILTGLRAEALAPGRAADALFTGLAIASIASVGVQLYQWLGLDHLGAMVLQLPLRGRPFANVGQANLLATLLAWGLIALWWAYDGGRLGRFGAALGAAFLLLGMAMTQSRTGWIEVGLLAAVAVARPRALQRVVPRLAVLMLASGFVALVLIWPQLGELLGVNPALTLADQSAAGKRPAIWRLGVEAIAAKPWLGWGWNEGGQAQVQLAAAHPALRGLMTPFMHNLALDLMLWNGIPVAALAMVGFAAWYWRCWRVEGSSQQRLLLLALAVLLIHAMLELPHGYAIFLLPAGLMIGLVEAHSGGRTVFTMPRWVAGGVVLVIAMTLVVLAREYRAVEQDLLALRMRAARIANLPPLGPAPRLVLMRPWAELLTSMRIEPSFGLDSASLDLMQRVAHHFPSTGNLLRLAHAAALNGRPAQASEALKLLCELQQEAVCTTAAQHWRELGRTAPALAVIEPPAPSLADSPAKEDAATIPRHRREPP